MSAAAIPAPVHTPRLRPAIKTPRLPPLPNRYDAILAQELELWHWMMPDLAAVPCRWPPDRLPWIVMPREGRPFRPVGTLALSQMAFYGVDTPALIEIVPTGYDGVVTEVICEISAPTPPGSGFIEGSGDLVWRLSADGRYLRDYGNMTVSHGSMRVQSSALRKGVRVYTDNRVVLSVAVAPAAAAVLNPQSTIICSIQGWYWPRR